MKGRTAVVTGAGRGIGLAIAHALGAEGITVLLAARSPNEVRMEVSELRARRIMAHAAVCDVTDEASVKALAREAEAKLGHVDILVNNAGVSSSAPLRKLSLDEWNRVMAVNATGVFLCTREFAPAMAERGWGRVITIASTSGLEGGRYIAHYCASKHAAVGFTRAAALELEDRGVTVNAICPAYVDTPMTERTLETVGQKTGLARDAALRAVLETAGQERLIRPEEVAAEVVRLCRDDASETGQAIVLNGRSG
ncbi:MAG TPA: SDR family NAD(P)-dependent oxidoreductase [Candidatus Eisenbacteria bacterium]|jgi:NAD(P)-dependent dehydrogenase (short-subunit alcohol dehydrogenase family)|nr:SDR family NAD(P)-dependent oxidoreductase [Candidatus Eisenbacteria bacterium]